MNNPNNQNHESDDSHNKDEINPSEEKKTNNEKTNSFKEAYEQIEELWGERLRLNSLTQEIELDGVPIKLGHLKVKLAIEENLNLSVHNLELALHYLVETRQYHPIEEYLAYCSEKYLDTNILNTLAQEYFDCDEPIYSTFLKRTLIAAVARILEPGCKVDTALILQGEQGFHKSSFFKVLAGPEYFDDSLGAISDKDEKLKLHQTWFAEWAELESVFKRKDISNTKNFLSSSVDVVRPPYGRQTETMPRRSIIVGTTNQDEFLSDPTGNRRFWVIPVQHPIDLERLKQDRDLIWGAAVALYKAKEQWWLTPEEEKQAQILIKDYLSSDPWQSKIETYIAQNQMTVVTTTDILNDCLGIELAQQTRREQMRVAKCLKYYGWESKRQTLQGKQQRAWVAPNPLETPPESEEHLKSSLDLEGQEVGNAENPDSTDTLANDSQPRQPETPSLEENHQAQLPDKSVEAEEETDLPIQQSFLDNHDITQGGSADYLDQQPDCSQDPSWDED